MNEVRLIDANALKEELLKVEHISWECDYAVTHETIKQVIDDAPTVEQKEFEQILQPIKVNIPEDIKDKLIEELSKPRKVILDESEPVRDCVIAYYDGFESARRLFERPKGEWILNKDENPECPFCHHSFTYWGNFCGHCGADMREEESSNG